MKNSVLAMAIGLACTSIGQAQQPAPVVAKVVLGVTEMETAAVAHGYRASKLIGSAVYNDHDEKIGKIGDLVLQPEGTISFAVIDVGGFLGVGSRHVAIPVKQFTAIKPKVVLPGATKEALKQLPAFEYTKG